MSAGRLLHVCISDCKGTTKNPVPHAVLQENHGLLGDAHAGPGHRQVSLLDEADVAGMRAKGLELAPGAFGENLVIAGLDLATLGIGSRLQVGQAELEITQIGKLCYDRCPIYHQTGDCIMPRAGVFARVLQGGKVAPGMSIEVVACVPRQTIQAAVLTVSDRCAAGTAKDTAGPAVSAQLQEELDAHMAWTGVAPDEREIITQILQGLAERGLDLMVAVGGTGCGPRDVTPEATRSVIEREVPGLAEAMRAASARLTPHALLQRGVCGIRGTTLILNLPGSEKAAVENLAAVLAALPHAVQLIRGDTAHPQADQARG